MIKKQGKGKKISRDYIKEIILIIPILESKKKIIDVYVRSGVPVSKEVYYLKAQIHFFDDELKLARSAFKKSRDEKRFYYLGMIEKKRGNLVDAENWFTKAVKENDKNPFFLEESKLMLAEIYYEWNHFSKSLNLLKELKSNQPLKYFLFYLALMSKKDKEKGDKVLKYIRSNLDNPQYQELWDKYLKGLAK